MTPEEIQAQVDSVVAWYKGLSNETKNYWTFRWVRMQDKEFETLYELMKVAEKVCKAVSKQEKKEKNYGRPQST